MNGIYISLETDPYFNIAAEYKRLMEAGEGTDLFIWQNQPCVIIGRNQNLYAESNIEYMEEKGILPARRFSGGGAVFQDMGNVNFTFITKEEHGDPKKFIEIIKKSISSFGIPCSFSGRNDLLYEGKKISGHASYSEDGNYMYHGTMMVNVDLDMLANSLKPSFVKLSSKGITSVRSRVINLSQINRSITEKRLKDALVDAFIQNYGEILPIKYLTKENTQPPLYNKIRQQDWIYGQSPQFEICVERRLSSGNVTIYANVANGLIKSIKIYSDSLVVVDFSHLEKELVGAMYREEILFSLIDNFLSSSVSDHNNLDML